MTGSTLLPRGVAFALTVCALTGSNVSADIELRGSTGLGFTVTARGCNGTSSASGWNQSFRDVGRLIERTREVSSEGACGGASAGATGVVSTSSFDEIVPVLWLSYELSGTTMIDTPGGSSLARINISGSNNSFSMAVLDEVAYRFSGRVGPTSSLSPVRVRLSIAEGATFTFGQQQSGDSWDVSGVAIPTTQFNDLTVSMSGGHQLPVAGALVDGLDVSWVLKVGQAPGVVPSGGFDDGFNGWRRNGSGRVSFPPSSWGRPGFQPRLAPGGPGDEALLATIVDTDASLPVLVYDYQFLGDAGTLTVTLGGVVIDTLHAAPGLAGPRTRAVVIPPALLDTVGLDLVFVLDGGPADDMLMDDVSFASVSALCPADFDGDNDVDLGDFGLFGTAFGSMQGDVNYNPAADFDNDGDVDLGDFGVFGNEFGRGPADCAP